ncbi:MAG: BRO-N domain-containing protein [Fusobacteriaceae bacterium]
MNKSVIETIKTEVILGKELRIFGDIDSPLFLAKDISEWIEHSNQSKMLDIVGGSKGVTLGYILTNGGKQEVKFLTEKQVYRILMRSDKPIALELQDGIFEFLKAWRKGDVKVVASTSQQQRLYERSPQELLADNAIALNRMFETIGVNIPKEIVISSAITGTSNAIGYDFPEVRCLLNKIEEETYHNKTEICGRVGIKRNKTNLALIELGLQESGSTTMQPFVLTELGKKYGVERSFTNGQHQGYEIKLKESAEMYIKDNIDLLPMSWVK